jgi:hypothetical protein
MNDLETHKLTEETFNRIWTKRSKLGKTWTGSDPSPCFDYEIDNYRDHFRNNYFKQDNWNDPAISDFRRILFDLDIDETKYINNVRIQRLVINDDESRYIIQNDVDVYVLSQYKSRGNIQSFVSTELGHQIHIFEFTRLLIDLGLEVL